MRTAGAGKETVEDIAPAVRAGDIALESMILNIFFWGLPRKCFGQQNVCEHTEESFEDGPQLVNHRVLDLRCLSQHLCISLKGKENNCFVLVLFIPANHPRMW
jgi:hypothetical protein